MNNPDGDKGRGRGKRLLKTCLWCRVKFRPRRRHAKTCSDKCRYDHWCAKHKAAAMLNELVKTNSPTKKASSK